MSSERLQKILAQAGIASRRAAEKYITEGRVRVNGEVVSELGAKADPTEDTIEVDGMGVIEAEPVVYIAMHKPMHVVTTVSDPEGRQTVLDVLQMSRAEGRKTFEGNMPRVFPVGRLDFDAEGLLVLTNDGGLANDLLHPRYHVPKTYVVKVKGRPEGRQLERLQRGVRLREEDGSMSRSTAPADVSVVRESPSNTWLEMVIVEGRHHQVKRMCEAVGHQVIRLIRTEFGGIELGELEPGQWRFLSEGEVELLRSWRAGNASELLAARQGPSMTERLFGATGGSRSGRRSGAPRERQVYRAGRDSGRSDERSGSRDHGSRRADRAPRGSSTGFAARGPRGSRSDRSPRGDFGVREHSSFDEHRGTRRDGGAEHYGAPRPAKRSRDFGDRPRGDEVRRPGPPRSMSPRGDSDRPQRSGFSGRNGNERSSSPRGDNSRGAPRGPRRDFGDRGAASNRGPRRDFGDRGSTPNRGQRRNFDDRGAVSDRGPRRDFGDRGSTPNRGPRRDFSNRGATPNRDPRRDGGRGAAARGSRRDFGDRGASERRPRHDGPSDRGEPSERRGPLRGGQGGHGGAPRGRSPRSPGRGPRR